MKKYTLIKILTPMAVAGTTVPIATIAIHNAVKHNKEVNKKVVTTKLNTNIQPDDVNLDEDLTPCTIQNVTDKPGWINIKVPCDGDGVRTAKATVKYRGQVWDHGWRWGTWNDAGDKGGINIPMEGGAKIQLMGIADAETDKGLVFSTKDQRITISFVESEGEKAGARFSVGGNCASFFATGDGDQTIMCGVTMDPKKSQYALAGLFADSDALTYVSPHFFGTTILNGTTTPHAAGIAAHCYEGMFENCVNLKTAPDLPGTGTWYWEETEVRHVTPGLPEACYKSMFAGCTSLQTSPYLRAYILGKDCYNSMFKGCTLLNSINIAYGGAFKKEYFDNWVQGVNSTGYMFYNGYDDGHAELYEIPKNFTTIANASIRNAGKTISIADGITDQTYTVDNANKAKTLIMADEPGGTGEENQLITIAQAIDQMDGYNPKTAGLTISNWYHDSATKVTLTDTVKSYAAAHTDGKIYPLYGATSEGLNEKLTNVVVNADTNIKVTYATVPAGSTEPSVSYKIDGKTDWIPFTNGAEQPFNKGERVFLKGNMLQTQQSEGNKTKIQILGGNVSLEGNIMSLLYDEEIAKTDDRSKKIDNSFQFKETFVGSTGLVSVADDFLPATKLSEMCYSGMFCGCSNLTKPPKLPATDLTGAGGCYNAMFYGCKSMTKAPDLPATTLGEPYINDWGGFVGCYGNMFVNCSGLVAVSDLPAETVPAASYREMFDGCHGLGTATNGVIPFQIHAKTFTNVQAQYSSLWNDDYGACSKMFLNCKGITNASNLFANSYTLAKGTFFQMFMNSSLVTAMSNLSATPTQGCYNGMFSSCTQLRRPPMLGNYGTVSTLATNCFNSMFSGCSKIYVASSQFEGFDLFLKITCNIPSGAVNNMFYGTRNTGGRYGVITPSKNVSYYA